MELGRILIIFILAVLVISTPLILLLGGYLHVAMSRAFDAKLFNNTYFSAFELQAFRSFPMSVFKTLAYIRGAVAPRSIKKRFNGYNFRKEIPRYLYFITAFWTILLFLTIFSLLISLGLLSINLFLVR